jgi:sialate O-acetylesterase
MNLNTLRTTCCQVACGLTLLALPATILAELKLPAIISDHMVLQQKQANPIWGWDTPGTDVTVKIDGQVKTAKAGDDGKWKVKIDPIDGGYSPFTIVIEGSSKRELTDVLVGEVWMCSGQSNMGMTLDGDWKSEVESLSSNHKNLRLITVPRVGTQELQNDFNGKWESATSENCKSFSAVGFFYGRYLHEILDVPVGLINNAWGGSAAEAWVRRESLENDPRFKSLIEGWVQRETDLQSDATKEKYETALATWKVKVAEAKAAGKQAPRAPGSPLSTLAGNHRPGNIFAGVVHPTLGYGMKGVIWYQGESNAGRAWEYAQLFPYMIEQWRAEWGQGDFPFYWVQPTSGRKRLIPAIVNGRNCVSHKRRPCRCRIRAKRSSSISAKPTTFIRKTNTTSPHDWCAGLWRRTTGSTSSRRVRHTQVSASPKTKPC